MEDGALRIRAGALTDAHGRQEAPVPARERTGSGLGLNICHCIPRITSSS